jgi:hypothetical protein
VEIAKALEVNSNFENKNSGNTWGFDKDNPIPKPGDEKVDCSGQQRRAIIETGTGDIFEGADHQREDGSWKNGVEIIATNPELETRELTEAEVGNLLIFSNDDGTSDYGHTGMISTIDVNDDGSIQNLTMKDSGGLRSSGKSGPRTTNVIKDGKQLYWGQRITGVRKWDSYGPVNLPSVTITPNNN